MKCPAKLAAIDAAMKIEDKLHNPRAGRRDITVDARGKINTWAHGSVPALRRHQIIGTYDARATVDMIADDLLAAPNFTGAHA